MYAGLSCLGGRLMCSIAERRTARVCVQGAVCHAPGVVSHLQVTNWLRRGECPRMIVFPLLISHHEGKCECEDCTVSCTPQPPPCVGLQVWCLCSAACVYQPVYQPLLGLEGKPTADAVGLSAQLVV